MQDTGEEKDDLFLVQKTLTRSKIQMIMTHTRIFTKVKKNAKGNCFRGYNGLKPRVGGKKADGTTLAVTTQENAIKETYDKRLAIPLDFDCVFIWP